MFKDTAWICSRLRDLARDAETHYTDDGDDEIFREDHWALTTASELLERTEQAKRDNLRLRRLRLRRE